MGAPRGFSSPNLLGQRAQSWILLAAVTQFAVIFPQTGAAWCCPKLLDLGNFGGGGVEREVGGAADLMAPLYERYPKGNLGFLQI